MAQVRPLTICQWNWFIGYSSLIQVVHSLIQKSLSESKFEAEGYPCHLAGIVPSLDPRIYEVDFMFLSLPSNRGPDFCL